MSAVRAAVHPLANQLLLGAAFMVKPRLDDPLTARQLREVLDYDPATGVFTWRWRDRLQGKQLAVNIQRAGKVAGLTKPHRYMHICINRRVYLAHRLAWLYVHGRWPSGEIDHVNEIKTDNRIANLREATHVQNNVRSKANNNNTRSGMLGVYPAGSSRWQAQIQHMGKVVYLGTFATIAEAKAARDEAARRLHGLFAHHD